MRSIHSRRSWPPLELLQRRQARIGLSAASGPQRIFGIRWSTQRWRVLLAKVIEGVRFQDGAGLIGDSRAAA